jgi:hypothetical protein
VKEAGRSRSEPTRAARRAPPSASSAGREPADTACDPIGAPLPSPAVSDFEQTPPEVKELLGKRISQLGLRLEGSPVERFVHQLYRELERKGVRKFRPVCYLTDEWGCPDGHPVIGIPFYLADPQLARLEREMNDLEDEREIMMYLRHEAGHAFNYAYRLYATPEWRKLFGPYNRRYRDHYRPVPFSRKFVRHIAGWYAQKHPDEDWAETFAVWMTPGLDWKAEYGDWPEALAKLEFCDGLMRELRETDPLVTEVELDEDVGDIPYTLDQYYRGWEADSGDLLPGLDGALKSIFEDWGRPEDLTTDAPRRPAAELILRLMRDLPADVYRWTGHFPERTRLLLRHLAERADALEQVYPEDREAPAVIALTTFVTALAMNHVHRGSYMP